MYKCVYKSTYSLQCRVYIKVVRHAQGAVKLVDAWRGGSSSKDHFSPCGTSSCRILRTKTRETEKGTGNEGAGWGRPGPRDRGDSRLAEDVPKEDVLRPRPAIAGHPSTSRHDSIEHATSPRPLQSDSSLRDPVDPHLIQRPLSPGTDVGSEDPLGSKESSRLEDLVSDDPRNPRILRLNSPKGSKKKAVFEDPRGFLSERENKSAFHANYLSCD
ncbi:hypothetical protein ALC57_01545 [Trachymyrmex cornetzi]|uniref:Uncharacterized protein n=1 Tax=Trachymyrmex cornetzi TaxID=471704 RepID=A0A151JPG5_9HYME|nr:hypothetical protein ALC57_01545 [Trachymyrmex cornetzi]